MNGASSFDGTHHTLSISGQTDVSFIGSGGPKTLWLSDFPVNVKESFGLYDVLRLLVDSRQTPYKLAPLRWILIMK